MSVGQFNPNLNDNEPGQSTVENFWIIAGGKFGLRAAKALSKADSSNNLTIVEEKKAVCSLK
jgi:hypothetical protein